MDGRPAAVNAPDVGTAHASDLELIEHHLDGHVVVELRGRIDAACAEHVDSVLRRLSSRYDGAQIRLDCAGVTAVAASGLTPVVVAARMVAHSGRMGVSNAPRALQDALADVGAAGLVELDRPDRLDDGVTT